MVNYIPHGYIIQKKIFDYLYIYTTRGWEQQFEIGGNVKCRVMSTGGQI